MSIFYKDIIRILSWKTDQRPMSGYFTRQHKWIGIFFILLLLLIIFSKLIQILPTETESRTCVDRLDKRHNQPTNNLLSYTREHLVQIKQQVRQSNMLWLPSGSITNIQRQKIYIQIIQEKTKNQKHISSRIQQHGVNFINILQIKLYNQNARQHD